MRNFLRDKMPATLNNETHTGGWKTQQCVQSSCMHCVSELGEQVLPDVLSGMKDVRDILPNLSMASRKLLLSHVITIEEAAATTMEVGAVGDGGIELTFARLASAVAAQPQPDSTIRRGFASLLHVRYGADNNMPIPVKGLSISQAMRSHVQSYEPYSPLLTAFFTGGGNAPQHFHNGSTSLSLPRSAVCFSESDGPVAPMTLEVHVVLLDDPLCHKPYAWAIKGSWDDKGPRPMWKPTPPCLQAFMEQADGTGGTCTGCVNPEPAATASSPSATVVNKLYETHTALEMGLVEVLHELLTYSEGSPNNNSGIRLALFFAEAHEHTSLLNMLMTGAMLNESRNEAEQAHAKLCLQCLLTLSALPELVKMPAQSAPGYPAGQAQESSVIPSYCICLLQQYRKLVSLPSSGSYTFEDVCKCLITKWEEWRLQDGVLPLIESIYAAWRWPLVLGHSVVVEGLQRRIESTETLLLELRGPEGLCTTVNLREIEVLLPNRAPLLDCNAATQLKMPSANAQP